MKHVVLYSGGANSAYMAWLLNQEHHKDLVLLHTPTYSEHPDADRFRQEFAERLNLPITVQADGRDLWQLIEHERCLPSSRIPFCSRILKTEQSIKYYKTLNDEFVVYFGYDALEWRRAQRSTARNDYIGVKTAYPLLTSSVDAKDFIKNELRICLPQPYLYLKHNNCIPCFKGGEPHFYAVWRHYPEYFEKAEKAEYNIGHSVFEGKSLSSFKNHWQAQPPLFDDEDLRPCMCAY